MFQKFSAKKYSAGCLFVVQLSSRTNERIVYMRGSIYINSFEGNPNHITLSPSASPTMLMSKRNMYGFAWQKTLDALGLEHGYPEPTDHMYHVSGSVPEAKSRAKRLESRIGIIASLAIKQSDGYPTGRGWISGIMGRIATRYLPSIGDDYGFMQMVGDITDPFADLTNDDGVNIYYDTTREAENRRAHIEILLHHLPLDTLLRIKPESDHYLTPEEFLGIVAYRKSRLGSKASEA